MPVGFTERPNGRRIAVSVLGILAVAFLCSAIADVAVQAQGIRPFYDSNPSSITFQEVRVPLRDGNSLSAYAVLPAGFAILPANSTPLTVLSPGINGHKESMLWKAYNFALNGFVAITVEARGNGDSSGIASFGIDEPADLSDTITWALDTFPAINSSKISLCGQSLGAMFSVLAACKDNRVAASAVYHPPANFAALLAGDFQIAQLVGALPNFPLDDASLQARSPINWIGAVLPRNILFLHGENDTEILPSNSFELSDRANATGNTDNFVVVRPGLNHPGNEEDPISLSLAIAWLNISLENGSVPSPAELWGSAAGITIQDIPSGSTDAAAGWLVAAAVMLFLAIFILFRDAAPAATTSQAPAAADRGPQRARHSRREAAGILGGLLVVALAVGLLVAFGATSVMWGYLLFFPAASLGFLVAVRLFLVRKSGAPLDVTKWMHDVQARNWAAGMASAGVTVVFFSLTYDACASAILQFGMSIFNSAFACYTVIFFLNFAVDLILLHLVTAPPAASGAGKHPLAGLGKGTGIVFVWRLASIALVIFSLPLLSYSAIPVPINLLVLAGIPAIMAAVYFLGGLLSAGTRSQTLAVVIIVVVLAAFLEYRMFRFF
ncbi:MAG: prolyl oligopeptidase family serine peptidase [Candidatus Lokiarchaeota archaeon]|nr:prolyl oligopeptidase family serine peptidase [Candidatus Lokiarchaeota archaeon]